MFLGEAAQLNSKQNATASMSRFAWIKFEASFIHTAILRWDGRHPISLLGTVSCDRLVPNPAPILPSKAEPKRKRSFVCECSKVLSAKEKRACYYVRREVAVTKLSLLLKKTRRWRKTRWGRVHHISWFGNQRRTKDQRSGHNPSYLLMWLHNLTLSDTMASNHETTTAHHTAQTTYFY